MNKLEPCSKLIQMYREDILGLSTRALGESLGFEPSYIRHVENGSRKPSMRFLAALRKTYGISIDTLIDYSDLGDTN